MKHEGGVTQIRFAEEKRLKQMWEWWRAVEAAACRYRVVLWCPCITLRAGRRWLVMANGQRERDEWVQCGRKCEPHCMYCKKVYDTADNSLKPITQRPEPLPRLKGDVKSLWPLAFMCIDPSGGGGVSSSKPSTISCYILVSPAGSGTFSLIHFF